MQSTLSATLPRVMQRASSIGVDACVDTSGFAGEYESVATEERVPVIALPKSDRVDAPGAGDAYGDEARGQTCFWRTGGVGRYWLPGLHSFLRGYAPLVRGRAPAF